MPQDYAESFLALRHMLRQGSGWSGHESNCVFLNTGGERFADVSATSGVDFDDDARGLALVDWDFDGDLDVWVTNRTGPRVRFLRNENASGSRFLAVSLTGIRDNRDAIGARLELEKRDGSRSIRTLHAGDGFLGQSSKWVHFGLGNGAIAKFVVRWPGGTREEFAALEPNRFYRIEQGSGKAVAWTPPQRELKLEGAPVPKASKDDRVRAVLASRVPAPPIRYRDFDAAEHEMAAEFAGRPLLVNLWASWCKPCVEEMRALVSRKSDLERSGLRILALSVDELGADTTDGASAARKLIGDLGFPFAVGFATGATLDMVELMHGALIHTLRPFPIPTSLLIDPSGWVTAVYQGVIDVDVLLSDVVVLGKVKNLLQRDRAVPFAGRWTRPQEFFDYLHAMGLEYLDAGYPQYTELHYRKLLETEPKNVQWRNYRGVALAALGRLDEAESEYRAALVQDGDHPEILGNLGTALLGQGRVQDALPVLSQAVELDPTRLDVRGSLGLALAEAGNPVDAAKHLRAALDKQPPQAEVANVLAWLIATRPGLDLGTPGDAVVIAETADALTGHRNAPVLDTLAAAYACASRFEEAVSTARRAIEIARAANQTELEQEIAARLQLYMTDRAYTETTP